MRTAAFFFATVVLGAGPGLAQGPAPSPPAGLEVRFCPAARVRTWPLESRRSIHSVVLQNALVVNRGPAPTEVVALDLALLDRGTVVDSRRIAGDELARVAATGPRVQASGQLELLAFQFCGKELIGEGVQLAGPLLAPGQALLVTQQPFAFRGERDTLRLRVQTRGAGGDGEAAGTLPVEMKTASTRFRFPLAGRWFVAVGPTMHTAHRWALPEEFALDVVRLGDGSSTHRGDGTRFADYHAYGAAVLAAAAGQVVAAVDGIAEDATTLRRPGESDDAFNQRIGAHQMGLIVQGANAVIGNHVILRHSDGEYSVYAHLLPGSVRVAPGDAVRAGEPIGKLGSSGNSSEPHLHFHVCDAPAPLACAGIPVEFEGVRLPWADYPRAIQSGDLVVAD